MGLNTEQLSYSGRIKITQMKNHHRSMARDVVCGGLQNKDIAKLYNMTESQVSIVVNSPLFQAELARLEALADNAVMEVKQRTALMIPKATKVLQNVLDRAAPDDIVDEETGLLLQKAPEADRADLKLGVQVALEVYDRVAPKAGPTSGGNLTLKQFNIDTRNMSNEELRDSVFDLLREA